MPPETWVCSVCDRRNASTVEVCVCCHRWCVWSGCNLRIENRGYFTKPSRYSFSDAEIDRWLELHQRGVS